MSKFKCDICETNPDELWMFGGFGIFTKDEKEYCKECFSKRILFFQSHKQEELKQPEKKEIE